MQDDRQSSAHDVLNVVLLQRAKELQEEHLGYSISTRQSGIVRSQICNKLEPV